MTGGAPSIPFALSNHPLNARVTRAWFAPPAVLRGSRISDLRGGYSGLLTNGPTWEEAPGLPGAVRFDGTNDLVNFGTGFDPVAPLTVTWVGRTRTLSSADEQTWWGKRNGTTCGLTFGIDLASSGSRSRLFFANPAGTFRIWGTTGTPMTADRWHHQCWVYDGASTPSYYVDGVSQAVSTVFGSGTPAILTNAVDAYMGKDVSPADEELEGSIAYMIFRSEAWPAAHVHWEYRQWRTGCPDLLSRISRRVFDEPVAAAGGGARRRRLLFSAR